jgi:hypothetical protein
MPPDYTPGNQVFTLLQKVHTRLFPTLCFIISVVHIYWGRAKGAEDCERDNDMMNHSFPRNWAGSSVKIASIPHPQCNATACGSFTV